MKTFHTKHSNHRTSIAFTLLLFSALCNVGVAEEKSAEEKSAEEKLLDAIEKSGSVTVDFNVEGKKQPVTLENVTVYRAKKKITAEDIIRMRNALKRKIKYEIDGKLYTLTDDDWSLLSDQQIQQYYERLGDKPYVFVRNPYLSPKKEKELPTFYMRNIDDYKKGGVFPLLSESIIEKTNNLSLYLANHTDDNGDKQTVGLGGGIKIYMLRPSKEYSKKVDVIENYYSVVNALAKLEMREIKGNFSLSNFGVSFCLVLKKDFTEEVMELYFRKYKYNNFIVVDAQKRKLYHLKDEKGILLKVFGEILATH